MNVAEDAFAILSFVADYPGVFGRHRASRVIVGNPSEEDIDRAPDLPVGGVAAIAGHPTHTAASVLRAIDTLIEAGLVAKTYGDRPRLVLTRNGWRYVSAMESLMEVAQ